MRILKNVAIILFAIVTAIFAIATFAPPPEISGVTQTVSFDGKTVHLAMKGDGPVNYSTETKDGTLVVNGQKLDLSDGNEFTVIFSGDGTYEVRKGAP